MRSDGIAMRAPTSQSNASAAPARRKNGASGSASQLVREARDRRVAQELPELRIEVRGARLEPDRDAPGADHLHVAVAPRGAHRHVVRAALGLLPAPAPVEIDVEIEIVPEL